MNSNFSHKAAAGMAALLALCCMMTSSGAATTTLADQPILAATVPGNLVLDLSVEFPTALSVANIGSYLDNTTYPGYFDPVKCYTYVYSATTEPGSTVVGSGSYFQATAKGSGTYFHQCSGLWSGNFMNWASMQTIDPFRQALTGGYRSVDSPSQTILEKAWGSSQGSLGNFNIRGTSQADPNNLPVTPTNLIPLVTPFSNWAAFNTQIWSLGNKMNFTATGSASVTGTSDLTSVSAANTLAASAFVYQVYIRVLVCDTTAPSLESNCVKYGSNYKPQGLMQSYANSIRYAAMSYLNSFGTTQQGGVLREPMGYIGPTYPAPLTGTATTNPKFEWSATDGTMGTNPDTASSSASGSVVAKRISSASPRRVRLSSAALAAAVQDDGSTSVREKRALRSG